MSFLQAVIIIFTEDETSNRSATCHFCKQCCCVQCSEYAVGAAIIDVMVGIGVYLVCAKGLTAQDSQSALSCLSCQSLASALGAEFLFRALSSPSQPSLTSPPSSHVDCCNQREGRVFAV